MVKAGDWALAQDAIKSCAQNMDSTLDLSNLGLTTIPREIVDLPFLRELKLVGNNLESLPQWITELPISGLDLSNNWLSEFPVTLLEIPKLKYLTLDSNGITALPEELGELTQLLVLSVNKNKLSKLPDSFSRLTSLTLFAFANNQFTHFPATILEVTSLASMWCYNNAIEDLPSEIGDLTNLSSFSIWHNKLRHIPREIGKLPLLEELWLRDNHLHALPTEIGRLTSLKYLDLDANELTSLPAELADLKNLERLSFENNPLPEAYFDALEQGVGAFQELLRSLSGDTRPLFEAKLLVTGEGQVGKSWALARLRDADPLLSVGNNTTWGIDRGELRVEHPHEGSVEIVLNTWDFGGQQIYRVTHQFFFSEQAIYLLVWNPRQGPDLCRVKEWLRMIALRTGSYRPKGERNEAAIDPRAKVIVVATHAQSEGGAYNPDYGRDGLEEDLKRLIVDEVAVDSTTGYNIDKLRSMIAKHAASLPGIGQPLNLRWSAARDAVLSLRKTSPWIDFDRFSRVCARHDVTGQEELRTLAWTYLHSLGRAIWYGTVSREGPEEAVLEDTIVLDAVWLSRAFVQILDDEKTRAAGGMLDHVRLPEIWTHHNRAGWHRYKPGEYEILKLVMRKFDVALPTRESEGRRSLVPQLVPSEVPTLPWGDAAAAPGAQTMRLSCKLDYEATGLMPRLIAATEPWHFYMNGSGLFWDSGIFLKETASFDNEALVTVRGTESPRIDVVVSGNQPAFLMQELYKVIEGSLAFWKGMTRSYYIRCPHILHSGDYCPGLFKYDAIVRRLQESSINNFDCQECDSVWSAQTLILGYERIMSSDSYMIHHLYRRDQLLCPRVFLLEPVAKKVARITSWSTFIGTRFRLTLISELSGQKIASQEFTFTREWVKWIRPVARVASLALTGAALPADATLATEFKEGASLLDKISSSFGEGDAAFGAEAAESTGDVHLTKQQLANFSKFLRAIGLDPRDQGMDIAQAPDGRWLWMSAEEVEAYRPQEAA